MLIKPMDPVHELDAQRKPDRDKAGGGAWPLVALERMLDDIDDQPFWRDRADRACDFADNVDNDQLTLAQKQECLRLGIPIRSVNLIGRLRNAVLGAEVKNRRDPTLSADDDEYSDVGDVLNVKLKEAQRETRADMAISQAHKDQVSAGVGWTEVRRNSDPFKYRYSVQFVPRQEMWWDWRSKQLDLSDCRWVCRAQWKDLDEVIAGFPKWAELLKRINLEIAPTWMPDGPIDEEIMRSYNEGASTRWRSRTAEWLHGQRDRIRVYHVQYRVPAMVAMLCFDKYGHRKIVIDENNPAHMEAIARKLGRLEKVPTMQIRNAIYAGPYRLLDKPTTLKRFIWTPFWAFRRDKDDTPFGLIESMIAPQEDYNDADMRVRWMLRAQQVYIDSDAVDGEAGNYNSIADIKATAMRPDAAFVLNANRRNLEGVRVKNDLTLQKELLEQKAEKRQVMQDVGGIYGPQLGDAPTGVTSGIAMGTLVDQGTQAMGDMNDNYLLGRQSTYDSLVDLIAEDHTQADLKVKIGTGDTRRVVVLNTRNPETGEPMNVVKDAPVKLGLGEAPQSPAHQAQTGELVGKMIQALQGTPHAGILIPNFVETSPMFGPGRKQMADDMRRATGMPTAGDRQGAQQWQAQAKEQAAQQAALQTATLEAEAAKKRAEAGQTEAAMGKTLADTKKVQADTLLTIEQIAQSTAANEEQLIDDALRELALEVTQAA
jgi:hypothetical protein